MMIMFALVCASGAYLDQISIKDTVHRTQQDRVVQKPQQAGPKLAQLGGGRWQEFRVITDLLPSEFTNPVHIHTLDSPAAPRR